MVLSLVNENEYVLIYDHGVAYAAFHRDFKPEFDIVYDEWLEGQKNARPEQDYSQAEIFFDNNTAELEQPEKSNKAGSSSHTRTISDPRSSSSLATDRSLHTAAPDPIYEHSPPRYGQPRTPQYSSSPSKPPESSHQQTDSTPQPKPVAKSPSKTSPPPNQQDTRDRGFSGTFRGLLAGRQVHCCVSPT